MKIYVLDAGAVIRYLSNGAGEGKVAVLIQRAVKGEVRLLISVVNWGEALYSLAQKAGLDNARADLKTPRTYRPPCSTSATSPGEQMAFAQRRARSSSSRPRNTSLPHEIRACSPERSAPAGIEITSGTGSPCR